jgi:hypothetical protein
MVLSVAQMASIGALSDNGFFYPDFLPRLRLAATPYRANLAVG